MALFELRHYVLAPIGNGQGLGEFQFDLNAGDVCFVNADNEEDANLFLRALATLVKPQKGTYDFKGERLDFSDYRNLLPYKRRIAYISPYSSFVSNRTLLDNLLLSRSYFENSISQELPETMSEMCRYLQIEDALTLRPAQVNAEQLQLAMIVRELCKGAELLLIDGWVDFMGLKKLDLILNLLTRILASGIPFVYSTSSKTFAEKYRNKEIILANGILTENVNRHS